MIQGCYWLKVLDILQCGQFHPKKKYTISYLYSSRWKTYSAMWTKNSIQFYIKTKYFNLKFPIAQRQEYKTRTLFVLFATFTATLAVMVIRITTENTSVWIQRCYRCSWFLRKGTTEVRLLVPLFTWADRDWNTYSSLYCIYGGYTIKPPMDAGNQRVANHIHTFQYIYLWYNLIYKLGTVRLTTVIVVTMYCNNLLCLWSH